MTASGATGGDRLGVGVIGGGMISQIAHLPFYLAHPQVDVIGVAETRPSLVEHLRQHFAVGNVVADHRELLSDSAVSTVVIVAPRPAAGPIVLEALEAGKDVITEKPMAHTADQARRQVEAAQTADAMFAVGFMKRYDAGVQVAKREFDRLNRCGRLGRLLLARFYDFAKSYARTPPPHKRPEESRAVRLPTWPLAPDWLPDRHADAYAWFVNAASHDVNLMRYFLGDGLELGFADAPTPDAVSAVYRSGDVQVVLEVAKSETGTWQQGAEFLFERGRLTLEVPSPMASDEIARVYVEAKEEEAGPQALDVTGEWCFEAQANSFVDDLLQRRTPLSNGADCLQDMVMIEDIWRAISSSTR